MEIEKINEELKKFLGSSRKPIEFEDDLVVVYNPSGEEIYKGLEDYEPMKDEDWKFNRSKMQYELDGYIKVCIEV